MHPWKIPAVSLALMLAVLPVRAGPAERSGEPRFQDIPADVLTDGFLSAHPDLMHRQRGMREDEAGDAVAARRQYALAARYADKPAQARLGEMHWNGEGGPRDRVDGFLFMALAAERGYPVFEQWKMRYWSQLSADERALAATRQASLLQQYGDAVAKARQAAVMRRELHRATGSLLGPGSGAMLYIVTPEGKSIDPQRFYARDFWQADAYWALQDRVWTAPSPGRVQVGEVETVAPEAPVPAPD